MEVCKSMPRIDFSRTVFVHLGPSLTLSHTQWRGGRTLHTQVRRHLPLGGDTLQALDWLTPRLCVQDDAECTCVLGVLFSTCEKYSRGEDNAPTLAKMRSFVSGLLGRTHHFPDQRQRGCIQEPMRFIMLLYI